MMRLVVILAVLAVTGAALAWFTTRPPAMVARTLRGLGLAALVAAGLVAMAAGLGPWITPRRAAAVWQARPRPHAPEAPSSAMSRDEAWMVLGLEPGASPEAVRAAHRRLMRLNHPDHGGSTWIAARLNQARDLLLDT